MEVSPMIELAKEQKIQIIEQRRMTISRNIFDLELDVVVVTSYGRAEDVEAIKKRIEELKSADLSLQQLINTL